MTLRSWCLRMKNHQWANSNWPIDRSECALYPSCVIILDSLHRFTTLVIEDCHQRVTYNRVKDTQMELCFKFWLVRGRQTDKKLLCDNNYVRNMRERHSNHCCHPLCLILEGQQNQPLCALTWTMQAHCMWRQLKKKTQKKAWISLHKCCVMRALHLDTPT